MEIGHMFSRGAMLLYLLLTLCGCSRQDRAAQVTIPSGTLRDKFAVRFLEPEIRSRTWTDVSAREMKLLDLVVTHCEQPPDLVIASYGDILSKRVYCLDFYEEFPVPAGDPRSMVLIGHDCGGPLKSLSTTNEDGRVEILICRSVESREPQLA